MCGIFTYFSNDYSVSNEVLSIALRSLHHRGPDENFYWISKNKQVGLAQSRLSIVDLNKIKVPISNETDQIYIIANGEFYDYARIRTELQNSGHQFKTKTDTEIALHLYEQKGMHCLNSLRGEFAFIIWDNYTKTLFAVRDRFGIKPLYYTINSAGIYFASEIPTLLQVGAVVPTWDHQAFYNFTHYNLKAEHTLLKNIFQIPPGSYMVVTEHEHRIVQYWDIDYPLLDDRNYYSSYTESEIIADIGDTLSQSIQLRLNADVPVGCYLSGGVDSSTLLGMASHFRKKPLEAFTISFDNERVDEGKIAARTAAHTGSNLHTVSVSERIIADNFEKAIIAVCSPIANAAGVARYLLSQSARAKGYKVVFSGEGADEVFFGYNFMLWEALTYNQHLFDLDNFDDLKNKMLNAFPVDRSNPKHVPNHISSVENLLGYVPKWLETQAYFNAAHRALLSDDFLNEFKVYDAYQHFLNGFNVNTQMRGREKVLQTNYLWMKSIFPNSMLNWIGDRAEMAHSIEAR